MRVKPKVAMLEAIKRPTRLILSMTAAAKRALKLVGLVNSELTDDFDSRLGVSTAIGANGVRSKTETSLFFLKGRVRFASNTDLDAD